MKKVMVTMGLFFMAIPIASAHPGRTDGSGCHTCRTNCSSWGLSSGEYHCHKAKSAPQPKEPIKSTYGDNGTGYTTPAPEYKNPDSVKAKKIEPKEIEISLDDKIKKEIEKAENDYYKNSHGFRENLVKKISSSLDVGEDVVGKQVYAYLPNLYSAEDAMTIYEIRKEVRNVESKYYQSPHGFREKLTRQIANHLKTTENKVGEHVYSMLPNL